MPKQTPLEKAIDLIGDFQHLTNELDDTAAISCALITTQEVIDSEPYQYIYDYWVLVKKELEKMLN